jgi:putative glycerol-1-phosphate prenyltransferase
MTKKVDNSQKNKKITPMTHNPPSPREIHLLCTMGLVLELLKNRRAQHKKSVALLCDPDIPSHQISNQVQKALSYGIDLFLVGGSHLSIGNTTECVKLIKSLGAPNVVLFPGNEVQVVQEADAILFMSLISGRNPDFLISKQVAAAPFVKSSNLEAIPTGYMLVESGKLTSALYISNTLPLPNNKPDIAAATAMAGELLGMQLFYLDAGSGAEYPIPQSIIHAVKSSTNGLVFVGGGIRTPLSAAAAWECGADVVVVGNGIFEDDSLMADLTVALRQINQRTSVSS